MDNLYLGVDVFFSEVAMPLGIRGFVKRETDRYYIVINSNLSSEQQKKTIRHEYMHLIRDEIAEVETPAKLIERRIEP